jgi:hypothetical protein
MSTASPATGGSLERRATPVLVFEDSSLPLLDAWDLLDAGELDVSLVFCSSAIGARSATGLLSGFGVVPAQAVKPNTVNTRATERNMGGVYAESRV